MENQPYFHTAKAMQDIRIFIEAALAKIRGVFPYATCQSKTVAQSPKHILSTTTKGSAHSRAPAGRSAAGRAGRLSAPGCGQGMKSAVLSTHAGGGPCGDRRGRPTLAWNEGAPTGACRGRRGGVFLPGSGHFPGAFKVMRPWLSQGKNTLANGPGGGTASGGGLTAVSYEVGDLLAARTPVRPFVQVDVVRTRFDAHQAHWRRRLC